MRSTRKSIVLCRTLWGETEFIKFSGARTAKINSISRLTCDDSFLHTQQGFRIFSWASAGYRPRPIKRYRESHHLLATFHRFPRNNTISEISDNKNSLSTYTRHASPGVARTSQGRKELPFCRIDNFSSLSFLKGTRSLYIALGLLPVDWCGEVACCRHYSINALISRHAREQMGTQGCRAC